MISGYIISIPASIDNIFMPHLYKKEQIGLGGKRSHNNEEQYNGYLVHKTGNAA